MWVIATAFHALPFLINPCPTHFVAMVLCQVYFILCLFQAPARFDCPAQETIRSDRFHVSAIALANPISFSRFCFRYAYHSKKAKFLSGQIANFTFIFHVLTSYIIILFSA